VIPLHCTEDTIQRLVGRQGRARTWLVALSFIFIRAYKGREIIGHTKTSHTDWIWRRSFFFLCLGWVQGGGINDTAEIMFFNVSRTDDDDTKVVDI
jgi:hypothetical protein